MDSFAQRVIAWHKQHGRKNLPWQQDINPYRVWVSEIMLQQTQVTTVIPYFHKFMDSFPTVNKLAAASLDHVLHHWTGLGYYARARNLHRAARMVVNDFHGEFPTDVDALTELPGIGQSTAGAIVSIAGNKRGVILDGNVKRVLTRFHAVSGYPGKSEVARQLWALADEHTPGEETGTYTQAIMDLGATLCVRKRPACTDCPVHEDCRARALGTPEQFPEPKPKREKPVRSARFFVVTHLGNMVLLQQRPTDGLWGGLWTPPERATDTTVEDFLDELQLGPAARIHIAPDFRHTFTHFHLDIEPVYIELQNIPEMSVAEGGYQWIQFADMTANNTTFGLSAPAVRLLGSLQTLELSAT